MAHIDDQRLMELALGAVAQSAEDSAHLAECPECRAALAAEADLSSTLRAMPMEQPPAFLAERIEAAFVAATAPSRAPMFALAVSLALLVPFSVMLLGRWTDLLASMWSMAVVTRVLTSLVVTHGSAPVLVAVQAAMLLGGVAVVTRLLKTTALAPEATQ